MFGSTLEMLKILGLAKKYLFLSVQKVTVFIFVYFELQESVFHLQFNIWTTKEKALVLGHTFFPETVLKSYLKTKQNI